MPPGGRARYSARQDLLPEGDPVSRAMAPGELRPDADRSLLLRAAAPLIDAELMLTGGLPSRSCPAWSTTSSSPCSPPSREPPRARRPADGPTAGRSGRPPRRRLADRHGAWPRPGSRSGVPATGRSPDLMDAALVVPARTARDGWIPPAAPPWAQPHNDHRVRGRCRPARRLWPSVRRGRCRGGSLSPPGYPGDLPCPTKGAAIQSHNDEDQSTLQRGTLGLRQERYGEAELH